MAFFFDHWRETCFLHWKAGTSYFCYLQLGRLFFPLVSAKTFLCWTVANPVFMQLCTILEPFSKVQRNAFWKIKTLVKLKMFRLSTVLKSTNDEETEHLCRMLNFATHTSRPFRSYFVLPPFSLIRDFGKQNNRGNVSKISVSLTCYRRVGSKSQPMTQRRSEGHTNGCDWWISIRSVDNA